MAMKISLLLLLASACSAHESQDDMPAVNSSLNADDEFEMRKSVETTSRVGLNNDGIGGKRGDDGGGGGTSNAYHFAYATAVENGPKMFREERKLSDGQVSGKYGYVDPNGHLRVVNYEAGENGFTATGDIGPDEEAMKEMRRMNEYDDRQRRPVMEHWNKVAHTLQLAGDHSNEWASAGSGPKSGEKFQRQRYIEYPNGYTTTRTFPTGYGFEHAVGNTWENALKNIQRTSAIAQNHQQAAWNYQKSLLAGQQRPMFGRPSTLPSSSSAWASSWSSNYPNQKTHTWSGGSGAHQTPFYNGHRSYQPAPPPPQPTPTWTQQHSYSQQHWPGKTFPAQYPSFQPPTPPTSTWTNRQPNYNTNFYTSSRFPSTNAWPPQRQPTWPGSRFDHPQQRTHSERYQYGRNIKSSESTTMTSRKTKRQPSLATGETRVSVTHAGPGGFSYSYAF